MQSQLNWEEMYFKVLPPSSPLLLEIELQDPWSEIQIFILKLQFLYLCQHLQKQLQVAVLENESSEWSEVHILFSGRQRGDSAVQAWPLS